ncbi:hypothetical protein CXG81DRAFT_20316 [Caulochytrium protostelioides]|uniref:WD40 repeat-like protein n=1 Tax=Caulochytrium protostelioides TaxID=1555241 RepID=A0A4P9X3L7_9FUNG|nr:hypothetical protein CXG81DRAFT_20316 [Caulochytrium protostelioides]|eukprot:RKO99626.1 hypothetical protein CXG81DRAFT_20316 [Caulochytrium protostelioides]
MADPSGAAAAPPPTAGSARSLAGAPPSSLPTPSAAAAAATPPTGSTLLSKTASAAKLGTAASLARMGTAASLARLSTAPSQAHLRSTAAMNGAAAGGLTPGGTAAASAAPPTPLPMPSAVETPAPPPPPTPAELGFFPLFLSTQTQDIFRLKVPPEPAEAAAGTASASAAAASGSDPASAAPAASASASSAKRSAGPAPGSASSLHLTGPLLPTGKAYQWRLLPRAEVLADMIARAAVSDFAPIKAEVQAATGPEILVVADPKYTYGQNYYAILDSDKIERITHPEKYAPVTYEGEAEAAAAAGAAAAAARRRRAGARAWTSYGSERDVAAMQTPDTGPPVQLRFTKQRIHFNRGYQFTDRPVVVLECRGGAEANLVPRVTTERGVQAVPVTTSRSLQTRQFAQRGFTQQTAPQDMDPAAKLDCLYSPEMQGFLQRALIDFERALQENDVVDIFAQDWRQLGEDEAQLEAVTTTVLSEAQSFTDLAFRGRSISCIAWHPDLKDVIAVSLNSRLTFDEQLEEGLAGPTSVAITAAGAAGAATATGAATGAAGAATTAAADGSGTGGGAQTRLSAIRGVVLVWFFHDPIHPQLLLEAPNPVTCFAWQSPATVVGACSNGQIVLWDITEHLELLVAGQVRRKGGASTPAGAMGSGGGAASGSTAAAATAAASSGAASRTARGESGPIHVSWVALSSVDASHQGPISQIRFLAKRQEIPNSAINGPPSASTGAAATAPAATAAASDADGKKDAEAAAAEASRPADATSGDAPVVADGTSPANGAVPAASAAASAASSAAAAATPNPCHQFVTVGIDGHVCIWDIRNKSGDIRALDGVWRPILRYCVDTPEDTASYALTGLSVCEGVPPAASGAGVGTTPVSAASLTVPPSVAQVEVSLLLGTEEGQLLWSGWQNVRNNELTKPRAVVPRTATGPVAAIHKSPFFDHIVMVAAGWSVRLWDLRNMAAPLITTPIAHAYVTSCAWSLTRPGVFFIGKSSGVLETWDLTDKTGGAAACQTVSPRGIAVITAATPPVSQRAAALPGAGGAGGRGASALAAASAAAASAAHTKTHLAVGDDVGTLHLLEIPRTLAKPAKGELAAVRDLFERHFRYMLLTTTAMARPGPAPLVVLKDHVQAAAATAAAVATAAGVATAATVAPPRGDAAANTSAASAGAATATAPTGAAPAPAALGSARPDSTKRSSTTVASAGGSRARSAKRDVAERGSTATSPGRAPPASGPDEPGASGPALTAAQLAARADPEEQAYRALEQQFLESIGLLAPSVEIA